MVLAEKGLADPRAYVRLAAILRHQIADGTLQPGGRTPSLTRLSQEYGHARLTCSKALRTLEAEGVLTRIPGLGYHVRVDRKPPGGQDPPVPFLFRQSMKIHAN